MTLTERGLAVHEQLQPLLESMRALRAVARDDEPGGTLRVSVPVPFGRLVGGSVIARYCTRMPGVHLEVLLQNTNVDLLRERIDLAIRAGDMPDSDLGTHRLARVPMWLYASARFADSESARIPLIAAPGDEALLSSHWSGLVPASAVVDDRTAARDALRAGAGAGVLPAFLGESARADGTLIRLDREPLSAISVHAVLLPEHRDDDRVRVLIELIEDELRRLSHADT